MKNKGKAIEAFEAAVVAGERTTVDALLLQSPELAAARNAGGVSFVLLALYHGQGEVAARIAAARDDLDAFEAAALGRLGRLRELASADPEALNAFSADGFTQLHLATFFGQLSAARFLLAQGADVDAVARNPSAVRPLHSAAATRDARIVRTVLAAGADPDAKQAGGHTALHSAVLHGNVPMAVALLSAGADPVARNDEGKSARDLTPSDNVEAIGRLLAEWTRDLPAAE